jgi:hypothetical protein
LPPAPEPAVEFLSWRDPNPLTALESESPRRAARQRDFDSTSALGSDSKLPPVSEAAVEFLPSRKLAPVPAFESGAQRRATRQIDFASAREPESELESTSALGLALEPDPSPLFDWQLPSRSNLDFEAKSARQSLPYPDLRSAP